LKERYALELLKLETVAKLSSWLDRETAMLENPDSVLGTGSAISFCSFDFSADYLPGLFFCAIFAKH